jgi:hypothetical protein
MGPCLHLPLHFERRETVRLLARKIATINEAYAPAAFGLAVALRIWNEWAATGKEFRLLKLPKNDNGQIDWSKEDMAFVIEDAAGLQIGDDGKLMQSALESGFISYEVREGVAGLILEGFWPLNEHLSPDFKSIQQRGGEARAAARFREESEKGARERKKIFDQQGILPFGSQQTTANEQEHCYALYLRLHRVCGLDGSPPAEKFSEQTMLDALYVVRNYTPDQIVKIEEWILSSRDNPQVVKIPERILEGIGKYAEAAGAI